MHPAIYVVQGGSAALLAARRQGGSGGSDYSLDAHAVGLGLSAGAGMAGIGGPMSAGHAGMRGAGMLARPLHAQQQQQQHQQQYAFGDGQPQQRQQQHHHHHQTFSSGHGGGGGGGGSSSNMAMDADHHYTADQRQPGGAGLGSWARLEQVGQSPYDAEGALGLGMRHGPQSADAYGRRSYAPGASVAGVGHVMGSEAGFMEGGGGGMMDLDTRALDTLISGGEHPFPTQQQAHMQIQAQQQMQPQQQPQAPAGLLAGSSRQHGGLGQQAQGHFNQQGRSDSPAAGFGPPGGGMDSFGGAPDAAGPGTSWGPSPDQLQMMDGPYDGGRGSAPYLMAGHQHQQQLLQHHGSMPLPGSHGAQQQVGTSQQGLGTVRNGVSADLLEQLHTSHSHRHHMAGAMEGPQYRGSGSGSGGYPPGMSVGTAMDEMQMGVAGMPRGSNLGPTGIGSAPPVRGPSTTGMQGGGDFSAQRTRVMQYQQQQQQPAHAYSQPLPSIMPGRSQQQAPHQQQEDQSNVVSGCATAINYVFLMFRRQFGISHVQSWLFLVVSVDRYALLACDASMLILDALFRRKNGALCSSASSC